MSLISFQRYLAFLTLLVLYVPLVARRLRGFPGVFRSSHPVDVSFLIAFILMTWLVPSREQVHSVLPFAIGLIVMVAFSSVVGLLYVTLVREARYIIKPLLSVMFVIDLAAIGVIHVTVVTGIGIHAFFLMLVLVTATVGWASVWVAVRIGGSRAAGP